jgi:CubicO group peptidase (beta-lactamase class C family)
MRTIRIVGLTLCFLAVPVLASPAAEPPPPWQNGIAAPSGWTVTASQAVEEFGRSFNPTSIAVVHEGRMVATWGDVSRKVNVRSVRKSLISALYGIAVAEKRISLDSTLAQLGIDDNPPSLSDAEKQATVRDLLMSRSGIYHPASYETAEMKEGRPARGSHAVGSFWYYNNWDFNALGTIYRKATGEDIFQSFARRIAEPLGMEDFTERDGRYVLEPASTHAAYPFRMSARDLARFGWLILSGGRWSEKQIIPTDWVRESTAAYSHTGHTASGYGYLWWVLPADKWGANAVAASGFGGQLVVIIPAKRLVAVETLDLPKGAKGIRTRDFLTLVQKIADAAPGRGE